MSNERRWAALGESLPIRSVLGEFFLHCCSIPSRQCKGEAVGRSSFPF